MYPDCCKRLLLHYVLQKGIHQDTLDNFFTCDLSAFLDTCITSEVLGNRMITRSPWMETERCREVQRRRICTYVLRTLMMQNVFQSGSPTDALHTFFEGDFWSIAEMSCTRVIPNDYGSNCGNENGCSTPWITEGIRMTWVKHECGWLQKTSASLCGPKRNPSGYSGQFFYM